MRNYISILFLCCASVAFGQSTNIFTLLHKNQKKADYFYDHLAWRNALELYLRITDKDPSDLHARQRIAECYVKLSDPTSAVLWYTPLAEEKDAAPSVKYEYADVLCSNGRYNEARRLYEEYSQAVPSDPMPKEKLEFLKHLNYYLRDSLLYKIIPINLNSSHSDFGPQVFEGGLVFVSSRNEDLFIKRHSLSSPSEEEALLNVFYSKKNTVGDFGEVKLFGSGNLKSNYHDGPIAFYNNYKKAAFTRNSNTHVKTAADKQGKMNLKIFLADVDSGVLKNVKPFINNSDSSSTAHASFTRNGKIMYFSSDRPNGYGGADIYFCNNKDGQWSEPVNAGPSINTAGDEFYPFASNDSTLFFSSNGHGGLGGLDIFVSSKRKGKFKKATNLGFPLNSIGDDFSLVSDSTGRIGYFASNRSGGQGLDDIYIFISDRYFTIGQTRDIADLSKIIPEVSIYVKDENGMVVDSAKSDKNGYFHLDLPLDQNFSISGKKEGYDMLEDLGYSTKGLHFGVDSLIFPLWKQELFVKGKIYSNETHELLPGAVVHLKNLTNNKVDSLVVGEKGDYSFLVYPNKKYQIEVTKQGYIPDGFNLNTQDLYKGELLNDVVLEEIYIRKEVTQFDYNKYDIKPESFTQLNHIVRTLKKFPKATLNIGAYADARGTNQYNQALSDKRAEATVQYFIKMGISRKRIEAKGFGEELILNRCSDGVDCSEEEHAVNRRVELKVQKDPVP